MNKQKFDALEVKPKFDGFYRVTLFYFEKSKYITTMLHFREGKWDYGERSNCYVCFIY